MSDDAKYKQLKVSLNPETVSAFKNACVNAGMSMASVISRLMMDYSNTPSKLKNMDKQHDYSTRRKRRTGISKIIKQLGQLKECEQAYIDRIPENLQSSSVYENAEEFLSCIENAIEALESSESV